MKERRISFISIPLLLVLAGILLAACGSSATALGSTGGNTSGSNAAGQILMQLHCTVCHSANRITSVQKTAAQWKVTVDRMVNKGAQLSPAEEQTLVTYLAQTYHP